MSANMFGIDATTGQVTVTDSTIDYETLYTNYLASGGAGETPVLALTVRATDPSGSYGEVVQRVAVLDQNEAPTIRAVSSSLVVPEDFTWLSLEPNTGQQGVLSAPFMVEDVDSQDDYRTLVLTIVKGDPGGRMFALDSDNHLTLRSAASLLDYETRPMYNLTLRVTDVGGQWSEHNVAVAVSDVNESPSFVVEHYVRSVLENSPTGTTLGSAQGPAAITGNDPDTPVLVHSIVEGVEGDAEGAAFAISSATGVLTTTSSSSLNHETQPVMSVVVRLSDGALHVETNVTIYIDNINEEPFFESPEVVHTIPFSSESTSGINVGPPMVALDPDVNDVPTYVLHQNSSVSIGSYTTNSLYCFQIGRTSGQVVYHDRTSANDCLTNSRVRFVDAWQ